MEEETALTHREYPLAGQFDFHANRDEAYNQLRQAIQTELPKLVGLLKGYAVDRHMAFTPLENAAKRQMMIASMTSVETFVDRLMDGDLDFFLEFLDRDPAIQGANSANRLSMMSTTEGLRILFSQIIEQLNTPVTMTRDQLMLLWAAANNETLDTISPNRFSKMLIRSGLIMTNGRNVLGAPNRTARGITITWHCENYPPDVLSQILRGRHGEIRAVN